MLRDYHSWFSQIPTIVSPWLPLIAGFLGAIIGAVSNAFLRQRSERLAARQELVGLVGSFTEDCMAAIANIQAAVVEKDKGAERWKARGAFQKEYGNGQALEIRVFREFRDRRARAAFHKVLSRLEKFKELVDSEYVISENQYHMAEDWVREQLSQATSFMARRARVALTDRKRLAFVGFRRVTRSDKSTLSFEDGPPPWKFHLEILIGGMDEASKADAAAYNRAKIERMVCPQHGRPAHVYFIGATSRNFSVEVEGCCEEFMQAVHDRLVRPGRAGEEDVSNLGVAG